MTHALPHSGESLKTSQGGLKEVYCGAIVGTQPLSCCASRMSRQILAYQRETSKLHMMDGPIRCACSSHPSFSRCGQSVSTLCMLLRIAALISLWMRLNSSFEQENSPTTGTSA